MLGYILTAIVSATVTMIVMACLQVGKDPNEDIQQQICSEPPQFTAETSPVMSVWAETSVDLEELNAPEPYLRRHLSACLKRKLADSMWEYATVTRCDDPKDLRAHYIATIKVVDTGTKNPLAKEEPENEHSCVLVRCNCHHCH